MSELTQLDSWLALAKHYDEIKDVHMREMFDADANRFEKYSLQINNILYDYSKNRVTDETMNLLLQLAKDADVASKIEAMFNGEHINHTEDRAVLHTALRDNSSESIMVDGIDVLPEIKAERERVKALAEKIRTRKWRGASNQAITDVVNIGIGGSHLGPLMVNEALRPHSLHDLNVHFVSNIDENHINDTLEYLNPETTFFIIASKTFSEPHRSLASLFSNAKTMCLGAFLRKADQFHDGGNTPARCARTQKARKSSPRLWAPASGL